MGAHTFHHQAVQSRRTFCADGDGPQVPIWYLAREPAYVASVTEEPNL